MNCNYSIEKRLVIGLLLGGIAVGNAAPLSIDPPAGSVRVIPEPTIEYTVNVLPNPGFERGIGNALPEYWSRFGQLNRGCPGSALVEGAAFEGTRCARLAAGETLRVPTEVMRVRRGKDTAVDGREPYVLSGYMRRANGTSGKTTCTLGLWGQVDVDDGNPRPELFETTCAPTDEWQRFELPVLIDLVLKINRWGIMGALFEARVSAVGGDVLLDALQLEHGTAATAYAGESTMSLTVPPPAPAIDDLAYVVRALQAPPAGADLAGAKGDVRLTVQRLNSASTRCVATGTVLFPRGTLFRKDRVRLFDATGTPVPVQTQVLARYAANGAIRSLYVAFPVDGDARAVDFTLRHGVASAREAARKRVAVQATADGVVVNTGVLKFALSRKGFRLFDKAWLDANGDGTYADSECVLEAEGTDGLAVIDDGGTRWESQHDTPTLVVERAGPVEAVIRAQGWHRDAAGQAKMGYIVRVFAYAGSAEVKIEHTFENLTRSGAPETGLRGIALALPFRHIAQSHVQAGGRRLPMGPEFYALQTAIDNDLRGTVVTPDDLRATVTRAGKTATEVRKLDGQFSFDTGRAAMALRIEDLGANYPLAVRADDDGVTVELWPTRGVKALLLTHGMAKTHRFWLGFAGKHEALTTLPGTARTVTDPAHMLASGAITWGVTPEQSTFKDVDAMLKRSFDLQAAVMDVVFPIGKFNVGDLPHHHTAQGWGNSETARSRNWLTQYLRTGDLRALAVAERTIRHTVDVDVDHVHGNQYTHNMHHALGGTSHVCHDYPEIMSTHYLLTGDLLVLDINRRNAASCRGWAVDRWKEWRQGRAHGWPAWHVAEMCDVTCEKANLDGALTIARRFRESIKVTDGKRTSLSGKGGLLYGGTNLNALMRIHRSTGDSDARSSFLEEMDHTIEQARAEGGWQFGNRFSVMADPMVYAWRITGDRTYIERGIEALETAARSTDRYLVNCLPLIAAAAELGIKPSTQPDYLRWGFKRKHTMYILAPGDKPFRGTYQRRGATKESEWWFKLHDPDGQPARDRVFKPMKEAKATFEVPAHGKTGAWRLEVHQGYPAMVDFAFPEAKGAVLQVDPGMGRFLCESARYWFRVPDSVKSFRIAMRKYYGNGTCGLAVYAPDGQLVQGCRWTPRAKYDQRTWHELDITVPGSMRGKLWTMVVALYDGQYQLRMEGVPPFVALTPNAYFLPENHE